MKPSQSFQDVVAWQKAHELVLSIYEETHQFPKEEAFGLTSQLRRAAVSTPANIAEGFKRMGLNDKIRFYNIAQSSLEEVKYFLILSKDLKYIKTNKSLLMADEVGKILEVYIKKIKEKITSTKS